MKKSLLILSILAVELTQAQTDRGTILLGAGFNYNQGKNSNKFENNPTGINETKYNNFSANLRIGYFVTNKVAVGLLVSNSMYTNNTKNGNGNPLSVRTDKTKTNTTSIGVFGRAYKTFAQDKFAFFGELSVAYSLGNSNLTDTYLDASGAQQTNKQNSDITGFNVGIRPGFVYFITKKIGLETTIGNLAFSNEKTVNYSGGQKTNTSTSSNLNFAVNASTIYLGVNFYL